MIRALHGKWVYDCRICDEITELDHPYAAIEYGQQHRGTIIHAHNELAAALNKFADELGKALRPALDAMASLTAKPNNTPHDPALRKDRRKWGGR